VDWAEWRDCLEELVGLGLTGEKVYLLVPRRGRGDLSRNQGEELAHAVHKYLFSGYSPASYRLQRLANQPAKESLPLLYFSAWLARQQEDAHAFWPPFCAAVVRNKLSDQTVQQSLAPLISTLWTTAHRELGLYRPQEGRVHVKWPQAHAGLTDGEIQLIGRVVAKNIGVPNEPPDELYGEPSEFLSLLRIWLQSESHVPKRLKRLISGQDGPALVVAELAQKLLLGLWPIEHPAAATPVKKLPPPFLRLDLHPIRLTLVVPAGSVPGYAMLQASYAGNMVQLETSYIERNNIKSYKSYEWPVNNIPWSSEVVLAGYDLPVTMKVLPECPFSRGRLGLIMFDPETGRCVRRWRPHHHYWLLTGSADIPSWVSNLFSDIETEDTCSLADLDITVLSAVGRDIVNELEHEDAWRTLQEMEEEINRSGALITLPDFGELVQPELSFCSGLPLTHGKYPVYLEGHNPLLLIKNVPQDGVTISVYNRDDTGNEFLLASAFINRENNENPAILELPTLGKGFYVIRGLSEPSYFSVTSELPPPASDMQVSLRLLRPDKVINADDVRYFETHGVEVTSWPYARVMFRVSTEEGSYANTIRMGSDGKRVVRAHEVELPKTAKWAKIKASAWLAVSESIELSLRPYVAPDEWILKGRKLVARIRGVDPGIEYVVAAISNKPWKDGIYESQGKMGTGCQIEINLPKIPQEGWIILMDSDYSYTWLFSRLGESKIMFDIQDFQELYSAKFVLPRYLSMVEQADDSLHQMCCLVRIANLAQCAKIPLPDDPLPGTLVRFVQSLKPTAFPVIQLPSAWRYKKATMEVVDSSSGYGFIEVDGGRYRVHVEPSGLGIKLRWLEHSPPCICGSCGRVMTQAQWFSHRHGNSLDVAPAREREFVAKPLADWPSVMHLVEQSLLDAIVQKNTAAPYGLESVWASLQESFRKRKIGGPVSPKEWVEMIFSSWRKLFYLVNDSDRDNAAYDWASLWASIEQYREGLANLEIGKM